MGLERIQDHQRYYKSVDLKYKLVCFYFETDHITDCNYFDIFALRITDHIQRLWF